MGPPTIHRGDHPSTNVSFTSKSTPGMPSGRAAAEVQRRKVLAALNHPCLFAAWNVGSEWGLRNGFGCMREMPLTRHRKRVLEILLGPPSVAQHRSPWGHMIRSDADGSRCALRMIRRDSYSRMLLCPGTGHR